MKVDPFVKTTVIVGRDLYKAAKHMAIERDTSVSAMLRAGLMLYLADPVRADKILNRRLK